MFLAVLWGVFKTLPEWQRSRTEARKLDIEDATQQRGERRDDLDHCQEELRKVNLRMDGLQETVGNLKIEMAGAITAYRILDAEVEKSNPASLGLAQARIIMSTAFAFAPSTTSHDRRERSDEP